MQKQAEEDILRMSIQPKVIDHLGINMYTNLHAVISELIANSYDALAVNVWIDVPDDIITDDYVITVRDDGTGMSFSELNMMYLQVGRNRREELDQKSKNDKSESEEERKVLGRKGIGKFAVFGVAKKVVIKAVKDGSVTEFEMDIDGIKAEKGEYKPTPIRKKEPTIESNGLTVTLKYLKRKNKINLDQLREGIANRFMLFSEAFRVYLDGKEITHDDMKVDDIEYTKEISEPVSEAHRDWIVKGTIWGRKGTVREAHNRGVSLFARGKLVQEPTFFGATSGKEFAYPHIFGRLTVDFVDDKNDVIGTNRASINWESEEGQELMTWGNKKLTDISVEFYKQHKEKREAVFGSLPETKELYSDLAPIEKKKAEKIVRTLASNTDLSQEGATELISYVKSVVQYASFHELADMISEQKPNEAPMIIDLFRQWEHVEAREMYHLLKGRMKTILQLKQFIEQDAKEVPIIHNYLRQFPWLLDPRWTVVYDEAKYSKLLREHFVEGDIPENDRRIDFLCFGAGPALIVVELKRPGKSIGMEDLNQLEQYVIFIQSHLAGNDPSFSPEDVYGFLICEKQQQKGEVGVKKKHLARNRMYVRQYSELMEKALQIHEEFTKKYGEIKNVTAQELAASSIAEEHEPM